MFRVKVNWFRSDLNMRNLFPKSFPFLFLIALTSFALAQTPSGPSWVSVGPDGGDVRSFSSDPANPAHIFLGTSAGQIYQSEDGGATWTRYVRIGKGNDYVIDHIVFDPAHPGTIYVAAWTLEREGGDVFKSVDGGHNWETMKAMAGKSVRALAIAPSDPNTLVAGALDGVFRTRDGGANWELISPQGSAEIKNVESIAIDPKDPKVIYAGTWHLPWKTSDGGKNWHNIKNGVIDDSDVFSIIIDPRQPQEVYASACSGIYKSDSAGELFHKIQGIPFSARRTRVLKQDPNHSEVVFAGTTEGLWKTSDSGRTWRRMTPTNVIVNDVLVDARDSAHVLLATDRSGVMASNNGAQSFAQSNRGFAHRQVASLIVDPESQSRLYAGVVNDKEYGGVFVSDDQGSDWRQLSAGLDGRDVFALRKTGVHLLAGTSGGVFKLEKIGKEERWRPIDHVVNEKEVIVRKATKHRKALVRKQIKTGTLHARVTDLEVHDGKWFAATSAGLFTSGNLGKSWEGGPIMGHSDLVLARISPKMTAVTGRKFLLLSLDDRHSWYEAKLPPVITSINDLAFAPDDSIWIACREGLYRSADAGDTWERILKLPVVDLASVFYDADSRRMLVTAMNSTEVFSSGDEGHSWQRADTGWLLRTVEDDGGRLIGSTAFDGVVMERPAATTAATSTAGLR